MNHSELVSKINTQKNCLCVGLDTDIEKLPLHLRGNIESIIVFNKQIIDATLPYCVAYKINTAFYESLGWRGWQVLEETFKYIPNTHLKIADAKRADIGNTSQQYAKAFFDVMQADAVTVSPYMGLDCLEPFFAYKNKFTIVLGLTSNEGSNDFENLNTDNGKLYKEVIQKTAAKYGAEQAMFVVGATKAIQMKEIRQLIPNHFLLVPGVGAQGGSLAETIANGRNADTGLLINASRSIIYAGSGEDFAIKAAEEAENVAAEMKLLL